MAKRIISIANLANAAATADATNLANNVFYTVLQGANATQTLRVVEIYLGGQAGSSAPMFVISARDSQVAVNVSAGNTTDAALDAATAALAAVPLTGNAISAGSTFAQRSSTLHLHNLSFNGFGGIVRLNWPLDQQSVVVGNAANTGEFSLSQFTGGTNGSATGMHLIYEPS